MSATTDTAGRAPPRASRFATIKTAFAKQARDLSRAHRRDAATQPPVLHRDAPRGALQAGIVPLRLLQAILDRADVIALDVPERGRVRRVHMLVTLPAWLLERATVIAAYNVDDEDTNDAEPEADDELGQDEEPSLGVPDLIVDQSRTFTAFGTDGDAELDPAEHEPSLGSLDGDMNQEHWAAGSRLDLEHGAAPGGLGGDCDDDEPDHDEPDLSPIAHQVSSHGAIDGEEDGYSRGRDPRDVAIREKLRAERSVGQAVQS